MLEKPSTTLPGTVEKIIPSVSPHEAGTVQISVHTADDLYREVRIKNTSGSPSAERGRTVPD
jgi:hypothetical protein